MTHIDMNHLALVGTYLLAAAALMVIGLRVAEWWVMHEPRRERNSRGAE